MSSFSVLYYLVVVFFWIIISAEESTKADDEAPLPLQPEDLYLPSHITRMLIPGYQEFAMVYRDVICRFRVLMRDRDAEQIQQYQYRAGAFCGDRFAEGVKRTIRDCAVFACTDESIDTCGKRFTNDTVNSTFAIFDELFIEGVLPITDLKINKVNLYPSAYNESFLPLENYNYSVNEEENHKVFNISLNDSEAELFVFGLLGMRESKEVSKVSNSSQNSKETKEFYELDKERVWDDEDEEVQEDNDDGMVQNLRSF